MPNCPHRKTLKERGAVTEEVHDPKTARTFRVSTFPYYSPKGDLIGSIHIARDITEEREKEVQLIMSDRLAALGQMASGIAHEINNPLASIAGCAEGLLSRVKKGKIDPELFENYLNIIAEEISRCKNITGSILSFVRKASYVKKDVEMKTLLDRTLELIGLQGRLEQVNVIRKYDPEMPALYISEGELRQVILAIMTNALDAMKDKGTLTLETGTGEGIAFMKISDTGPGILPEHIDEIFKPFFTTKAETGGTGLGLAIATKIINNHRGSIDVFSETGKGTAFIINLPL
jgi:signal transduction histidine kinase